VVVLSETAAAPFGSPQDTAAGEKPPCSIAAFAERKATLSRMTNPHPFEPHRRMSTAPEETRLIVNARLQIPLAEFTTSYARSSGPGGQNVNKVNSKAVLRWRVLESGSLRDDVRQRFLARYRNRITGDGELIISSQRFRDAPRNAADCLEKLRAMLAAIVLPPTPRRPTRPTRSSQRRRLQDKRLQGAKKQGRGKISRDPD